ncbi:MAG: thioredoxin domain-containing protein [Candidatus Kapabacteria bacterium]|nr:thioredoxin domain-containing protein [Candidatus Kapabacteria bacterium]MBP7092422.1 thioredoxin domain-containing protein [Candidatus Kapabacteria bacterium]
MPIEPHTNRLAHEQSPYLLQHASNPVAWYPWSNEAFEQARAENKPVFVSIGYATCHWCHVMAHESFEDETVAAYLNEHYICIKVDREERPDVDAICMDVCQSLTGHGGWPLTIMMDADRRPFFAGTYFPRYSFGNRLGFLDLLQRLKEVWVLDHARVIDTAREITESLTKQAEADFRGNVPPDVIEIAVDHHKRMYDDVYGGFSVKPKFPSPHHLLLLLRSAVTLDDKGLLSMVCTTLDAMRAGGIYDQVGYGFHRYSTDRQWLVPHFEKMLYDQAMMMMAYTDAWQITRDELYRSVVVEIAEYLRREMTSESGAFFSAQDADSEGVEGKFYVWNANEWSDASPELQSLLNVRADGNFHDEATGNPSEDNIPHVEIGRLRELMSNEEWTSFRVTLLERRAQRIPPLTDDKILADWNGLMIGALARAGRAFNDLSLTTMAERAYAAFTHPVVFHRTRNGHSAVPSMLDDHAMMGWAGMELYQTTGAVSYLRDALENADIILERFADDNGALYLISRDVTDVPVRQKQGYDSAYPCGNSMAALLFAGLGAITNNRRYREAAQACINTYGTQLAKYAPGFCMLLCAWDTLAVGSTEIVFNGAMDSPFITQARTYISSVYRPRAYFIHRPSDEQGASLLREASYPFDVSPENSVLICTDYTCALPITEIELLVTGY